MKLREYGLIAWQLSQSKTISSEEVGGLLWEIKDLVDDWGLENTGEVGNNIKWFLEDWKDYEKLQDLTEEVESKT